MVLAGLSVSNQIFLMAMSSSPELLRHIRFYVSQWLNPIGGQILLYFHSYFYFNQMFAFLLKNLSTLKVKLFTLGLFVFSCSSTWPHWSPPPFCFSLRLLLHCLTLFFPSFPLVSFPFLLQHSDRKQLVDITDDDLQPHIHFLSQIYEARHLEGQPRNGRCIFYEQ